MENKTLKKIAYLLLLTVFFAVQREACASETVRMREILTAEEIEEIKNDGDAYFNYSNNLLGDDYYERAIPADRPEFQIKNPVDYIKEKKQAKNEVVSDVEPKGADIEISCDEMEYFEDTNELEARGGVEITTPDGVRAKADKAIYNKDNNTIKLIDNVVLIKNGTTVSGGYMLIDLNEENALMDEPVTRMGNLIVTANEGFAYSGRLENINGSVGFNERVEMELSSQGFSRYGRSINDKRLVDFELKKQRSKPYKFKTKQIIIRPERDHDSMLMKDVDIYYGKRKILNSPSVEFFSDKEMTYSEANFPLEFGSLKGFGMYLGLGYTFKLPQTYTFRLTPALVYGDSELGLGAMAQLKSNRMRLEAGWASSTNNLIVDGELKVTDKLKLDLGRHVYKSEWFNGGTRAGYIAELAYDDSYLVKDLGNAVFRHRITAGYVADYRRKHQEDDMRDGYRYRYQAQLSKKLKSFGSKEQDMYLDISAIAQTMASVYSETGDTVGLFRVGPSITSKVKRWNSNITYTLGGVHGKSPYAFDEYRYGRQTVSFDESLILNRFLSVGYRGTLTPLKDNNAKDVLTENRFYAVAGPEDFKVAFSYDTIRQNMHFDFLFLLGSDNLELKYDKLTVENPDKLGKHQRRTSDRELYKVKIPENL